MESNKTEFKIKPLVVIIIVIISICITAPIAWFIGTKSNIKSSSIETKEEVSSTENDQNITIKVIKEELYNNSDENSVRKVELTDDGSILVTLKTEDYGGKGINIERKEIIKNVDKYYEFQTGMSDICLGSTKLIFILKDSTISYLDLDQLDCGDSIEFENKIDDINNIKDIIQEKTPGKCLEGTDYCEPDNYFVYAIDKNNNRIDITERIH